MLMIYFFHKGLTLYENIQLLLVFCGFNIAFKICSLSDLKKKHLSQMLKK